mmetsp:Transcript_45228/g.98358  ORF Transcript_45228/g.98358 Transcript_45228/m.98358 type:complete len:100 (-) Transcript_45228:64-363(-)
MLYSLYSLYSASVLAMLMLTRLAIRASAGVGTSSTLPFALFCDCGNGHQSVWKDDDVPPGNLGTAGLHMLLAPESTVCHFGRSLPRFIHSKVVTPWHAR